VLGANRRYWLAHNIGTVFSVGRDGHSRAMVWATRVLLLLLPLASLVLAVAQASVFDYANATVGSRRGRDDTGLGLTSASPLFIPRRARRQARHARWAVWATLATAVALPLLELCLGFLAFGRTVEDGPDFTFLQMVENEPEPEPDTETTSLLGGATAAAAARRAARNQVSPTAESVPSPVLASPVGVAAFPRGGGELGLRRRTQGRRAGALTFGSAASNSKPTHAGRRRSGAWPRGNGGSSSRCLRRHARPCRRAPRPSPFVRMGWGKHRWVRY
jgi:hypothetical protein